LLAAGNAVLPDSQPLQEALHKSLASRARQLATASNQAIDANPTPAPSAIAQLHQNQIASGDVEFLPVRPSTPPV
jgi:hypothetical protein